jgi:hypothetical protein
VAICVLFHHATAFPTGDPIRRIDAAVIAKCRANPGLHFALATDYELGMALPLEDDEANRAIYGTSVDLREPRSEYALHIQVKGATGAIHTDRWNPRAGFKPWLLHGTLEVPMIPLFIVMVSTAVLAFRGGSRETRAAREAGT